MRRPIILHNMSIRVLVIGVGKMGLAHLKVLYDLKPSALAAWAPSQRGKFEVENLGAIFLSEDLINAIKIFSPSHVIISSPMETLFENITKLIRYGIKNILVEKPMTLNLDQANILLNLIKDNKINFSVAYNRRYYSSFLTALRLVEKSCETIDSVFFEFNEVMHAVSGPEGKNKQVKNKWVLGNSMHVIDMAFYPVGLPSYFKSNFNTNGNDLDWHPTASIFYGSGITETSIPFSYHANWKSPGSWGFEWMTSSTRYIFKPLEKLKIIKKDSFETEEVMLDDRLDIKYKPGVYLQNQAFLSGNNSKSVSAEYAIKLITLANEFGGYNK